MRNDKDILQALTCASEGIDLYLALLKKHEPTNKEDLTDAQFLKELVQVQVNLLTMKE
jgi:hypothetical protein